MDSFNTCRDEATTNNRPTSKRPWMVEIDTEGQFQVVRGVGALPMTLEEALAACEAANDASEASADLVALYYPMFPEDPPNLLL
jgi:hypothetical protein